jgi:hypothetical protein
MCAGMRGVRKRVGLRAWMHVCVCARASLCEVCVCTPVRARLGHAIYSMARGFVPAALLQCLSRKQSKASTVKLVVSQPFCAE